MLIIFQGFNFFASLDNILCFLQMFGTVKASFGTQVKVKVDFGSLL